MSWAFRSFSIDARAEVKLALTPAITHNRYINAFEATLVPFSELKIRWPSDLTQWYRTQLIDYRTLERQSLRMVMMKYLFVILS